MSKVAANRVMSGASVSEVETLWYDTSRWTAFVDGFGHIERADGEWPEAGSRVVWDSRPGGRGRVVERTSDYEPGRRHVATVEDETLEGTQTVHFVREEDGCRVTVELEYTRKDKGGLAQMFDLLFVRSAVKSSIKRTLARFERELTGDRELAAQ